MVASRNAKHGGNSRERDRPQATKSYPAVSQATRAQLCTCVVLEKQRERESSFGPAYLSVINTTLIVSIYLLHVSYPSFRAPIKIYSIYAPLFRFGRICGLNLHYRFSYYKGGDNHTISIFNEPSIYVLIYNCKIVVIFENFVMDVKIKDDRL